MVNSVLLKCFGYTSNESQNMFYLKTERVGLRKFVDKDLPAFAAMNANPEVMEFFPETLTAEQCRDYIKRINAKIDEQGFGFWAAELLESKQFIGFVGLTNVSYKTEFTPAVEIGWRLAREFWGKGLVTEAAKDCLKFAFEKIELDEVVSFTTVTNRRSYAVMERLGMICVGEFNHPKIESGHPLERHVLYKINRQQFFEAE